MRAAWWLPVVAVLGVAGCFRGPASDTAEPAVDVPLPWPFVCGQNLDTADLSGTRLGLTMAVAAVEHVSDDTGPVVTLRYTVEAPLKVETGRPDLVEMLYLRNGVIVGGGPRLSDAHNDAWPATALPEIPFQVAPGKPADVTIGAREGLCASFNWSWHHIWAAPDGFRVLVIQGRVEQRGDVALVHPPGPGEPLLAARAGLPH